MENARKREPYKLVILKPGEATEWKSAQNDNSRGRAEIIRRLMLWAALTASAGGAAYVFL